MHKLDVQLPKLVMVADHPDYCGCLKPAGAWGDGGWHFRRFNSEDLWKMAHHEARKGLGTGASEYDVNTNAEKHHVEMVTLYLGLPVAYEQCQAFIAKRRGEVATKKNSRSGDLGDDL